MRIDNVPERYKKALKAIRRKARDKGVRIRFVHSTEVFQEDEHFEEGSRGYYSYEDKELAIAINHPFEKWFGVLLHESCHLDQYLEDPKEYNRLAISVDHFFNWKSKTREFNKKQMAKFVADVIDLERDCEQRVVAKIKKWKLPIDVKDYTQRANAILYSYIIHGDIRVWKQTGGQFEEAVKDIMPTYFLADYSDIPDKMVQVYLQLTVEE
jgi:hypothetical protein